MTNGILNVRLLFLPRTQFHRNASTLLPFLSYGASTSGGISRHFASLGSSIFI